VTAQPPAAQISTRIDGGSDVRRRPSIPAIWASATATAITLTYDFHGAESSELIQTGQSSTRKASAEKPITARASV
jgi:hypothetical protein